MNAETIEGLVATFCAVGNDDDLLLLGVIRDAWEDCHGQDEVTRRVQFFMHRQAEVMALTPADEIPRNTQETIIDAGRQVHVLERLLGNRTVRDIHAETGRDEYLHRHRHGPTLLLASLLVFRHGLRRDGKPLWTSLRRSKLLRESYLCTVLRLVGVMDVDEYVRRIFVKKLKRNRHMRHPDLGIGVTATWYYLCCAVHGDKLNKTHTADTTYLNSYDWASKAVDRLEEAAHNDNRHPRGKTTVNACQTRAWTNRAMWELKKHKLGPDWLPATWGQELAK